MSRILNQKKTIPDLARDLANFETEIDFEEGLLDKKFVETVQSHLDLTKTALLV